MSSLRWDDEVERRIYSQPGAIENLYFLYMLLLSAVREARVRLIEVRMGRGARRSEEERGGARGDIGTTSTPPSLIASRKPAVFTRTPAATK